MNTVRGHYQNAYVTHDVDRACEALGKALGLDDWRVFEVEFPVQTQQGELLQATKVACAWGGGLQVELIQPVSGFIDPFLPSLPTDKADASPRFHHISLRRESMDEIEAEIAALGLPVVCRGGIPDLQYTYLDARPQLGHYLELVWASPAGWEMVGWPEGLEML